MSAYTDAVARREYEAANTPEARVARDKCPVCPGDLDTGFECNECGFDAMHIAMTDPRMTPTNDAPVTVEQCDREAAHRTMLAMHGDDWRGLLKGNEDQHTLVQSFARHRLTALASAPAGDGVEEARSLIESIARPFPGDCDWEFQARACQVIAEQALAALARPRAAVGEQSRALIARAVHGALSRANINAYLHMPDDTAEKIADAILALQSPPAKVEGEQSREAIAAALRKAAEKADSEDLSHVWELGMTGREEEWLYLADAILALRSSLVKVD